MDDLRKYKLALTGFVAMVILNIAILVFLWVMKPPHYHHHDDKPQFRVQRFIEHELDLSAEQQKAFDELRHEHMRRSRDIIKDMYRQRKELTELQKVDEGSARELKVDSLTTLLGNDQRQLEKAVFNHFSNLRRLCSEEQKKKFDHVMQEIIRRFDPKSKDEKQDSLSER